ncbi:MAG TPA: DNA (cytosine-5-)-methyltransferase [Bacteroidales bacterium]|jgi:DNA (cytosine-5)-methyltransferase 1|nr:DNA (cytosine-5-)-methyltransferase [Bacteroidales bacterium]
MVKYSELRRKYKIAVDNSTDDGLAGLTHFLHNQKNGTPLYRDFAIEYLQENNIVADPPLFSEYLPIKWDVPFPPPDNPKFKFVDLFCGIGGIRLAYQNLGGASVFSSDIDNYAKITYELNFGEVPFGDITKINEKDIPDHDLLLAGFPCQPFSIAGVSKKTSLGRKHGFLDETQGTLFFDIARILKEKRPRAFMLENVKNLASHDKKKTFTVIKNVLDELRYKVFSAVLDGKHFVPQHRERIIIVGFNKDIYGEDVQFSFPDLPEPKHKIRTILEPNPDPKYTLTNKLWHYLQDYAEKHRAKGNGFGYGLTNLDGIARTLSARYYKDGAEILIPQHNRNPRRLTPRECARLQGFSDKFKIEVSDNRAYKQFGNSVVVPLIQAVGEKVVEVLLHKMQD